MLRSQRQQIKQSVTVHCERQCAFHASCSAANGQVSSTKQRTSAHIYSHQSAKFCPVIGNLYPHMCTKFG